MTKSTKLTEVKKKVDEIKREDSLLTVKQDRLHFLKLINQIKETERNISWMRRAKIGRALQLSKGAEIKEKDTWGNIKTATQLTVDLEMIEANIAGLVQNREIYIDDLKDFVKDANLKVVLKKIKEHYKTSKIWYEAFK